MSCLRLPLLETPLMQCGVLSCSAVVSAGSIMSLMQREGWGERGFGDGERKVTAAAALEGWSGRLQQRKTRRRGGR